MMRFYYSGRHLCVVLGTILLYAMLLRNLSQDQKAHALLRLIALFHALMRVGKLICPGGGHVLCSCHRGGGGGDAFLGQLSEAFCCDCACLG